MNAAELIVFDLEREDDIVVEAEPHVGGATSRVEVANYLDVRVSHHFAMSAREFQREHLLSAFRHRSYSYHVLEAFRHRAEAKNFLHRLDNHVTAAHLRTV